jgi:hypothetical protein
VHAVHRFIAVTESRGSGTDGPLKGLSADLRHLTYSGRPISGVLFRVPTWARTLDAADSPLVPLEYKAVHSGPFCQPDFPRSLKETRTGPGATEISTLCGSTPLRFTNFPRKK